MAQKADIAQDLRRVVNFFKSLETAADAMEQIGSLELAAEEAKKSKTVADSSRDKVLAELNASKAKIEQAQIEAGMIVQKAKTEADEMVAQGRADAQALVAKAQTDAKNYLNAAVSEAQAMKDRIGTDITAAQSAKEVAVSAAAQAAAEADAANALAKEAERRLASIQAQIAKLAAA